MAEDEGSLDRQGGVEGRLDALEGRVADLTAEIAALRAAAAASATQGPAMTPSAAMPSPAAPVPPGPAFQTPPAGPPLASGWARYAPNAQSAPPPPLGPTAWTGPTAGPGDLPVPDFVQPGPPPPRAPNWSFSELEERLTGRLLAYVGGAAVLLGAILFLSLAFSRGWIGPEGRVAIGLVAAGVAFGLGVWLFETRPAQAVVATVLVGVGLGVGTISIVGATRLYDLVPVELGLIGSLVLAIAAAIVAIRVDSRTIGAFGLLAVLGAPPLLGATPGPLTLALIATTLVGTTIVALQRKWRWFPLLAFGLSVFQLNSWLAGDAPVGLGLVAVGAFWLIHAVAAGGEELLRPTNRLRDSSAMLLVANATFLVWAGVMLLDGDNERWRGAFLLAVALAHAVFAAACIWRQGDRHPFGLLVAGTGLAALTMAVPLQFGGSAVVLAWSAEAVVLAWLSAKRDHPHAGYAAATIASLAVAHFVLVEDPLWHLGRAPAAGTPFLDPAGATLAFMLVAAAVAAWFLRDPLIRLALGVAATIVVAYALPFELPTPWVVIALAGLAVVVFAAARLDPLAALTAPWLGLWLAAAGAILAVAAVALPDRLVLSDGPIVDPFVGYVAFVALAAALTIGTYLGALRLVGPWPLIAAGGILVYVVSVAIVDAFAGRIGGSTPVEELAKQAQVALSVAWTLIGAVTFAAALVRRIGPARQAGLALLALGTTKVFLFDLASLDVAYRVLSLVGLGLLLLGSAYAYQRLRPGRVATP